MRFKTVSAAWISFTLSLSFATQALALDDLIEQDLATLNVMLDPMSIVASAKLPIKAVVNAQGDLVGLKIGDKNSAIALTDSKGVAITALQAGKKISVPLVFNPKVPDKFKDKMKISIPETYCSVDTLCAKVSDAKSKGNDKKSMFYVDGTALNPQSGGKVRFKYPKSFITGSSNEDEWILAKKDGRWMIQHAHPKTGKLETVQTIELRSTGTGLGLAEPEYTWLDPNALVATALKAQAVADPRSVYDQMRDTHMDIITHESVLYRSQASLANPAPAKADAPVSSNVSGGRWSARPARD